MKHSWILSLSALFLPVGASFADDCLSRSGPKEVEHCLSVQKVKTSKSQRKAATFPVRFHGVMWDKNEGKKIGIDWFSENGKVLSISTPHVCGALGCASIGKTINEIPVERIVSFQQKVAGSGNNASEQVQSVAITAFLFPIAAPFAAVINAKSHEIYEWSVSYISDMGIEQVETFVTSSTVPVADRYYTFLPTLTGMKNGERKGDDKLAEIRKRGLLKLDTKLTKLEKLLAVVDSKKPWCVKINKTQLPSVYSEYLETLNNSNKLRGLLNEDERIDPAGIDSETSWKQFLEANPNTKVWAEANPTAAEKFKSCPPV